MSKADDLNTARLQGMDYAFRQIKENGLDVFEKELQWRMKHGISMRLSQKEIDQSSLEFRQQFVAMTVCIAILVLHDEFGFGKKRLKQFETRYNIKSESLLSNYVSWDDYFALASEIIGEKFGIRWERK